MVETTDKREENKLSVSPPVGVPATSTPENAPSSTNGKPFVSLGKRAHNEITYRGVDWGLNSTVGVAWAYFTERGAGKPIGDFITNTFRGMIRPIVKPESLTEASKWGSRFASIMMGGTAIIPVMVWLNHKNVEKKITRWFDKKIYGKEAVENDPKFEESYKRIENEPKKDFWTGMVARVIALAPLVYLSVNPKTKQWLTEHLYDPIGNQTKRLTYKFKKGTYTKIDSKVPTDLLPKEDYIHRMIGFDFGLTIFYSVLHELAYKTLAACGMGQEKWKCPPGIDGKDQSCEPEPLPIPGEAALTNLASKPTSREKAPIEPRGSYTHEAEANRNGLQPTL